LRDFHPTGQISTECAGAARSIALSTHAKAVVSEQVHAMESEPLIQKLFALERAVGKVGNITLRAMIIEAEEAALAMDREILLRLRAEETGVPAMTNASLARDLATRGGGLTGSDTGAGTLESGYSIGFSQSDRKSA
jgi:hypothetical protein